jgi:hypothetical protein
MKLQTVKTAIPGARAPDAQGCTLVLFVVCPPTQGAETPQRPLSGQTEPRSGAGGARCVDTHYIQLVFRYSATHYIQLVFRYLDTHYIQLVFRCLDTHSI